MVQVKWWGACWGRETVVKNSFPYSHQALGFCGECGRASHDAHISESRYGAPASVAGLACYAPGRRGASNEMRGFFVALGMTISNFVEMTSEDFLVWRF